MKILSVDDSAIIRKIIKMAVEVIEYDFIEAPDAEEALVTIEKQYEDISLILLDWNMPGMDGFELLKRIKAHEQFKCIPVMMVTTESEKINIIKAIQAGAIHYVIKPFTMEEVTEKNVRGSWERRINLEKDRAYLEKCIEVAFNDVIETMAGLNIEKSNEDITADINRGEITGAMIIIGEKNALMSITMSKELAGTIISYMTGILPKDLKCEDIYDGVAELINMIAGRTKALLTGTKFYFNITPPFTIIGKDHYILQKHNVLKINQKYTILDKDIYIEVSYTH